MSRNGENLTIGALASAAGVPASTVRYYEREGLLTPERRTPSNYRVYGPASLEKLRFILAAKAAGFPLADVRRLLELRDAHGPRCPEVQAMIQARLDDLDRQIADLDSARQVLKEWFCACRQGEPEGRCHVISKLRVASQSDPGSSPENLN